MTDGESIRDHLGNSLQILYFAEKRAPNGGPVILERDEYESIVERLAASYDLAKTKEPGS